MGHGDNCDEHDLPHPCNLCRIDQLIAEGEEVIVGNETWKQITLLMERIRQLELVNSTQFLLIGNIEKNVKELLIRDATKTELLSSAEQHIVVLRNQLDAITERLNNGVD